MDFVFHSRRARRLLILLLLPTILGTAATAQENDSAETVIVAAVQFEVSEEIYRSTSHLQNRLDGLIAEARDEYGADIVVFPEYINTFLIASRYPDVLAESEDLFAAVAEIGDGSKDDDAIAEVLRAHAEFVADTAIAMWSELARRHGVTLVAGTLFAPSVEPDAAGENIAVSGIRNQLLVFDEDGDISYTQDKVYLTPIESDLLGIEPGPIAAAAPIIVEGLEIGFTICRDGYFSAWNRRLGGVDLWISLRANGEPYTQEVYERFLTAMPERVSETDAAAGISASLTGDFLGAVWAGPSYVVDESGERIAATDLPVGTQIVTVRMERSGDEWTAQPGSPAN